MRRGAEVPLLHGMLRPAVPWSTSDLRALRVTDRVNRKAVHGRRPIRRSEMLKKAVWVESAVLTLSGLSDDPVASVGFVRWAPFGGAEARRLLLQ